METAVGSTDWGARMEAEAAQAMVSQISVAMGSGPMAADYQAFIEAQFTAHNVVSAATTRTVAFGTAYQATTPTKPAHVTIKVRVTITVGIGTPQANTVILYTGPTTGVATGTGTGTIDADRYRSDLSVTLISLGFTGEQSLKAVIPVGHYFAIVAAVGSGATIVSSFDQVIG